MRCDDVIRELMTPSDRSNRDELAMHLSDCAKCAEVAERLERVETAWEATRPEEPAPHVFDRIWSDVCRRFDATRHETRPATIPSWTRRSFVIARFAAAAAFLVAGIVVIQQLQGPAKVQPQVANITPKELKIQPPITSAEAPIALFSIRPIELGPSGDGLTVINLEGNKAEVTIIPPAETANQTMVAASFEMFGPIESMAD
jgi:hypothetical protein